MSTQVTRTRILQAKKTIITFDTKLFTMTDEAGVGQYGSVKLMDFPAQQSVMIKAVSFKGDILLLTPFINTFDGDWTIGSTAASEGNKANSANHLFSPLALAQAVAKATAFKSGAAGAFRANPASLYLNIWVDDNAAHATGSNHVLNGVAVVEWSALGDID